MSPTNALNFGRALDMDGDLLVIGSDLRPDGAHVYRWNGSSWGFEQQLQRADRVDPNGYLGMNITISGNTILTSAQMDPLGADGMPCPNNSGSVYFFKPRLGVIASARAFLEGAIISPGLMRHTITGMGLLPPIDPYTAMGGSNTYGVSEEVLPGALSPDVEHPVVDWIHLELRAANGSYTTLAARNALLLSNGNIVDMDGISPVSFPDVQPGLYHIAVMHRNHLGVMSEHPVHLGTVTTPVPFDDPQFDVHGDEARKNLFGTMALWAGDTNQDGKLRYTGAENDRDPILVRVGGSVPTYTTSGYYAEDVNLDGVVRYVGAANDRDPVLSNIGGAVPTATRAAQLP